MKTGGIDFGTTNTAIGYNDGNKIDMIPLQSNGSTTDTTCVFYSFEEDGIPIVGDEGKSECIDGERGRLITSPKKFLKNDELPDIQILTEKYDLLDVISHILVHFKKKLEKQAGETIDSILVGRPVRFHDTDNVQDQIAENRLKKAFIQAGFKNVEFQLEPIAAFNTYSNLHPELKSIENNSLVVDLGGGTSDFSLINTTNSLSKVLGNSGVYIGGDNLDERLILNQYAQFLGKGSKQRTMNGTEIDIPSHIYNRFADKSKMLFFKEYEKVVNELIPLLIYPNDKIALGRLSEVFKDISIGYSFHSLIEDIKKELSVKSEVSSSFDMFKTPFSHTLNIQEFNEIIERELLQIKKAMTEVLTITGIQGKDVDYVILNGGTSLVPIIQSMVNEIVGEGKILTGNTLSSVGYGLTLESYDRFK